MRKIFYLLFSVLFIAFCTPVLGQDNSPYSRYGLGDQVPSTNVNTRAMGGISSGYTDFFSINFNNPASYASFYAIKEGIKSGKLLFGRAILDVGIALENRTLVQPNNIGKFNASNFLFSHVQVAVPLRSGWGVSFGLRPLTRISYKISQGGHVIDSQTGLPTGDSTTTLNEGDGGAYLASLGTGFRIKNLRLGANVGYMFGKKDYSTKKNILNDTVSFNPANFETKTSFGGLYLNAGMQYDIRFDSSTILTIGAYGNIQQKLNATQDLIRETFLNDPNNGPVRLDSVFEQKGVKGKIQYPASYTAGLTLQRIPSIKKGGYLIGVDIHQGKWSDYRYYGQPDSLRNKWELRVGGELRPSLTAARKGYWGGVVYRMGFFMGPDYIKVKGDLPTFGVTLGAGMPIINWNRLNNQKTFINLAFEYIKRGNNDNLLKENLFRFSVGFALSDLWFAKKKYE